MYTFIFIFASNTGTSKHCMLRVDSILLNMLLSKRTEKEANRACTPSNDNDFPE